jgi:hypothetical protein
VHPKWHPERRWLKFESAAAATPTPQAHHQARLAISSDGLVSRGARPRAVRQRGLWPPGAGGQPGAVTAELHTQGRLRCVRSHCTGPSALRDSGRRFQTQEDGGVG